jgi:hypothetical protein
LRSYIPLLSFSPHVSILHFAHVFRLIRWGVLIISDLSLDLISILWLV